mmetsp:Transcript_21635/g.61624  ORF Transcript_21635/g.61624 Transcript_21635/m.61624 type:complete len:158 (+) Transcript_21635:1-474(+)
MLALDQANYDGVHRTSSLGMIDFDSIDEDGEVLFEEEVLEIAALKLDSFDRETLTNSYGLPVLDTIQPVSGGPTRAASSRQAPLRHTLRDIELTRVSTASSLLRTVDDAECEVILRAKREPGDSDRVPRRSSYSSVDSGGSSGSDHSPLFVDALGRT